MQLLGAPERLVAAASERRRIAQSPGVDVIAEAIVPPADVKMLRLTIQPTANRSRAGKPAYTIEPGRSVKPPCWTVIGRASRRLSERAKLT